jgi:hypothetical protein
MTAKHEPEHLRIGRAEMEAFAQRLDAWLREQPVQDQVLMAILTQEPVSAGDGQRTTLPAFTPGWTKAVCEWKLKLLASGAVEFEPGSSALVLDIDDPQVETKQTAEIDLGDLFHDAYSW